MQLSDLSSLVSSRLNEAGAPIFYPASEITAALNEALRFFTLATLSLEKTAPWVPASTFSHLSTIFPDFLVVLRITRASTGTKVRPCRIGDLWSLDANWPTTFGPVARYAAAGYDLCAVYPFEGDTLNVTYARAPVALVNAGDVPEVPEEYHVQLVNYGIWRLRQVEGGAVLQSVIPLLDEFMGACREYAAYMRARHLGANYDTLPAEFALADRSRRAAAAPTPEAVAS
jgi:hypothetical protein